MSESVTDTQDQTWRSRWAQETAWSARESARLCCNLNPETEVVPDAAAFNAAMGRILRAVRTKELIAVDLVVPATREEFFYRDIPLLRPHEVTAWARRYYPQFPFQLADLSMDTSSSSTAPPSDVSGATPTVEDLTTSIGQPSPLPIASVVHSTSARPELTGTPGERLKRLRSEAKLTLKELAAKVGIDEATVRRHATDQAVPHPPTQKTYAEVFSAELGRPVRASELFPDDAPPQTPPKGPPNA